MAQVLPGPIVRVPPQFPAALQSYLELSSEQVTAIQRLNAAGRQFETEKINRAAQVQVELVQETAKTPLDAMALGVRHVELEAIRRELRAQQQRTYDEIQKVLTPAQKTKVQALIDAMRLQGVICEAQTENILPVASFGNRWFDTGTFNFLPVPPGPGPILSGGSGQSLASFLLGPICPASRSGLIGGLIQ